MTLRSLHLENYKQYGALDLEFRDGLIGIIGRNGAGKSTLFEAILYCLFGKDEINKSYIRSSFADPKANVTLTLQFAIDTVEYAVKREFRGKAMAVSAELFKNEQLIAKGVAPVNDEISKVLNMERDAFKRSVFSGQKELSELSQANGEQRKKMVRKMLGLDTLDDIQTRVNGDARDLNNQIAGQRQNLLDPEVATGMETDIAEKTGVLEGNALALKAEQEKLAQLQQVYQEAQKKFEAEEQKQKRHQALQEEIGRLQERAEGLQKQRVALAQKIGDLLAQEEKLNGQKTGFTAFEQDKKRLQQLELEHKRHLNRIARQTQLDELHPALEQTKRRIAELVDILTGKETTDKALLEKKTLLDSIKRDIELKREAFNAIKSRMDDLAARIDERRSKLQNLQTIGRDGACPTCFQPVLDAYDQVLTQLNAEIETMQKGDLALMEQQKLAITQAGQELKTQQETTRQALEKLQAEQAHLQDISRQKTHEESTLKNYQDQAASIQVILRQIGEVNFDEPAFNTLKTNVEATEPRYLQFTNESAYLARELPTARAALQQTEAALAETAQLTEVRSTERKQTEYDPGQYETVKQAVTRYGDAFAAQSGQVNTLEKTGLELQNTIGQLREKLRANARIHEQISAKLAEVDLLKKLGEMLLQFKTEILEKISPGISREASALFSRITKGKYERIHVDENFDFSIADGGLLYPIERFSGGEIDLANFCLRIAITKAIMNLSGNGQSVEFLAFDEIFGSQDEERRDEIMLALNYLKEQFRQIYIISHIESQRDNFPNLLEVTLMPEGSVVKWV